VVWPLNRRILQSTRSFRILSNVQKHTKKAGVAQLVEHLICNQRVGGSNPFAGSMN
jgi:hypothetical protein